MDHFNNPLTDALNLVQVETIHRGWFTPAPTINAEEGFLLEHYRGNVHINWFTSKQLPPSRHAPDVRDGDTIFRLNLGPRSQLIQGTLQTWDSYTRPYSLLVDFQIGDPAQLLTLYRQEADPVGLAVRAIKEAIQDAASRTIYEDIKPANLVARVESAFYREPNQCKAGLRVVGVHEPSLGPDPSYQPVMLRQLLPLEGNLTTQDGYARKYKVQVELEVVNLYDYKHHNLTGEKPLKLAEATIHGELQRRVHELFYEDLTEIDLHDFIEKKAFAAFHNQARAGLKITRANNFWLGADATYEPLPRIHILLINNTLKTLEGYSRDYEVKVELELVDRVAYLNRSREGTVPLSLAQAAIEGEILQAAGRQPYEALNDETYLSQRVKHAFDKLSNHMTGGLSIKQVHYFSLQPAPDYVMTRVLEITAEIKTSDVRTCSYIMTVEVKVGDAATYVQLTRDGTDPLNLAKEAILGAIAELARGKMHDEVLQIDLAKTAEAIFAQAPNEMIGGLKIAKAHKAIIDIDANVKAISEIRHAREVDSTELSEKSILMKQAQEKEHELKLAAEVNNYNLTLQRQQTAEAQALFQMRRDQLNALSNGQIEFWQKAFQIATEDLAAGSTTAEVLGNMQILIQNIQGNLPQIAGGVPAQEQKLLQDKQAQEPVLHSGQPVEEEQVVETAATGKPEKKTWGEIGLSLMEVSVPPALRHLLDDREHAVQIRKVEAGSLARQAEIRTGDFLIRLQEQEINTIHDIDVVLESIQGLDDLEIAVTHNDGLVDEYTLHLTRNDEK
jgi:hypothetical protein